MEKRVDRETNKRIGKRGQVSVFVIIAVIVAVAIVGFIFFKGSGDEKYFNQADIKPQLNNIQASVLNCMEDASRAGLEIIGVQGGYYKEPKEYFDLGWAFIPYYYKEGEFLMPPKQTIESELGKFVDENLVYCMDSLEFDSFDLSYGDTKTSAVINENEVSFVIDSPVTISREGKSIDFETSKHPVSIESSLYDMIYIADYVTESHREDPEMICISCLTDMAIERELYVDMLDFADATTTLVVISTNSSSEPLAFEFLNKYTESSGEENTEL